MTAQAPQKEALQTIDIILLRMAGIIFCIGMILIAGVEVYMQWFAIQLPWLTELQFSIAILAAIAALNGFLTMRGKKNTTAKFLTRLAVVFFSITAILYTAKALLP